MTERRPSYHNSTRRPWAWGVALIGALLGSQTAVPMRLAAQAPGDLSGTWTLDRDASQFPREIGFVADFLRLPNADGRPSGGGRGRRGADSAGSGGGGLQPALRPQGDSFDDGQRRERLTDEVRMPPVGLTIVETPDVVTFSDDSGNVRSVHPGGPAETLSVGGTPVLTVARREGGKLIVLYAVADLRQIRYTYARLEGSASLAVDVEFIERNRPGDAIRRVYKTIVPAATPLAATASTGGSPPGLPKAGASAPGTAVPRAGSEFTGLKRIGIVVEQVSTQAAACGLKRETLESAAAKPFTEAGLRTSLNSDEDTYVHVTLMTSALPGGLCVTRYDWSLYSMTDATLSYQRTPLLVQVLLAHKGGLAGSMPSVHGAEVIRGMTDGLTLVAGAIRDANR